jgi:hypothetical protein
LKRIVFSDDAKADIRAIPQQAAMSILGAIHPLAETGAGRVKPMIRVYPRSILEKVRPKVVISDPNSWRGDRNRT